MSQANIKQKLNKLKLKKERINERMKRRISQETKQMNEITSGEMAHVTDLKLQ